ncbi:MAG: hypothetical protein HAW60_02185 [Bdellovibrionales bacterium]|nr:hypothetical protein [Bdellovibrionales bacterium]
MHNNYSILFCIFYFFLFFTPTNSNAKIIVNNINRPSLLSSKTDSTFFIYLQNNYFWNIDSKYSNKIGKIGFGGVGKYKKLNFKQELFYSAYESVFYVKSEELFLDYKPWFIGQKKHLWSWADSVWKNNLWQAEFYQNPSQPVSMGLLGLHLQKQYNKMSYYVFFSPVFLPRYSSNISIKSNLIRSFTPWLHSVPVQFNNLPIQYKVDKFSTIKLIAKNSIAFQIKYKADSKVFINSAFSYKPSNFIFIGLKPALSADALNVNIKPYAITESLATIETGVKKEFWSLLLSSSYRAYKKKKVEKDYFFDKLSNVFLYNIYYSIKNNQGHSIFTSYQKVSGYKKKSYNEYIELQESLFSYIYNYLDAVTAGVIVNNFFNILGSEYKLQVTYDFKQKASMLSSNLLWKIKPQVRLLLNVTNFYKSKKAEYNSNFFLHKFSNNNFIQVGVKYEF